MTDPTPLPRRAQIAMEELEASMKPRAPMPLPPRPAVAQPVEIEDLGRMSGEAVLTQYEAAAKAVEEMGDSVKVRVRNIAAALLEADEDMKQIAETAAQIREKGRHVQAQIEEASALSNDIRNACVEFKKKVGLP